MKTLNELFDKPVKWKLEDSSSQSRDYAFEVGEVRYVVGMMRSKATKFPDYMGAWEVYFIDVGFKGGIKITGKGNEIQVFSTVVDTIKDFLKDEKPEKWFFDAKESSRRKLYDALSKKLIKGYTLSTEILNGEKRYLLTRK